MPRAKKAPGYQEPGTASIPDGQTQPITVATGQKQGEAKAQREAQQEIPLPQARDMASLLAAAQNEPFDPIDLEAMTDRPQEPITAGLPIGAGPGPEVLKSTQGPRAADILEDIATALGDDALMALAYEARSRGV